MPTWQCSQTSDPASKAPAPHIHPPLPLPPPCCSRRWISPYLLRSDVGLGAVPAVAVCLAACKLAHTGLTAGALALLAGALLLVASTFLPAWMGLAAWQARRTAATAALRLVGTLLFAWHLAVAAAPAPGAAGTLEALLVDSGALALLLLPIRCESGAAARAAA